jgi:hypothetical protein
MLSCEIIFVKRAGGWKWRRVDDKSKPLGEPSAETYQLFYECVTAARARGYQPSQKCL